MTSTNTPLRIVFVCTHNSCRSIMAEAMARHLSDGRLIASSVGSEPSGRVNPQALSTLAQHNIDITQLTSKSWQDIADFNADIVVTVCDNAAAEPCPISQDSALHVHWGLKDPSAMKTAEQNLIEKAFTETLSIITTCLKTLLALPLESMSKQELSGALEDIAGRYTLAYRAG